MSKRRVVGLERLRETFFVRKMLNQDHALHLGELYESGVKLPPILVSPETDDGFYDIIDGRHRYHGLQLTGAKAVEIEVDSETDRARLLVKALKANIGGSLPPTTGDITHSIRLMIEAGMPKSVIAKELPFPPSLVRKYLSSVTAGLTRDKTERAVKAVAEEGITVAEAARRHGVDPESVKAVVAGNRRRKTNTGELKAALTNAYRGRSRVLANILKKSLQLFEDGDMTAAKVIEIFEHVDDLHKRAAKTMQDWEKRFQSLREMKNGK